MENDSSSVLFRKGDAVYVAVQTPSRPVYVLRDVATDQTVTIYQDEMEAQGYKELIPAEVHYLVKENLLEHIATLEKTIADLQTKNPNTTYPIDKTQDQNTTP